VKDNKEKDEIRTKPDKIKSKREVLKVQTQAGQSQSPVKVKKASKNGSTTKAQQVELDNALVSLGNHHVISKCNMMINLRMKPKEPTYQVVLDAFALTTCYHAFLITAEVPELNSQYQRKKSDSTILSEESHSKKKPAKAKKVAATKTKPSKKKAPVKADRGKGLDEKDDDGEDESEDESNQDKVEDNDDDDDNNDDDMNDDEETNSKRTESDKIKILDLNKSSFEEHAEEEDKLLNLDNPSRTDNTIASLMDTTVHHEEPSSQTSAQHTVPIMAIPEITSIFTIIVPPPPPFFNHPSHQATPTPTPTTSKATTSTPALPDFASMFKFNETVTNLERNLSEMKQVEQYAQALSYIPAIVDRYIDNKLGEAIHKAIQSHNA
nr:hypothetical protein [Tanacetum cinerariifolium]